MSPSPPESPDEQPPGKPAPPARPAMDSSELDLWDFDEEPAAPVLRTPAAPAGGRSRSVTPAPRQLGGSAEPEEPPAAKRQPPPKTPRPFEMRQNSDDIGELEDGNGVQTPSPTHHGEPKPKVQIKRSTTTVPAEHSAAPAFLPDREPAVEDGPGMAPPDATERRPEAKAPSPKFALTGLEKIGLLGLALILVISGAVLLVKAKHQLPVVSSDAGRPSFPAVGESVTVVGADSFWREPIAGQDTVRRGTKLIPVVRLHLKEGSSGAIRVFFRNENEKEDFIVGDTILRRVTGGTIEISASAGLKEASDHTAYRTGELRPWTIQVDVAPSVDSPAADFKTLFTMPLSNDRQ